MSSISAPETRTAKSPSSSPSWSSTSGITMRSTTSAPQGLKALLLLKGNQRITTMTIPWYLKE